MPSGRSARVRGSIGQVEPERSDRVRPGGPAPSEAYDGRKPRTQNDRGQIKSPSQNDASVNHTEAGRPGGTVSDIFGGEMIILDVASQAVKGA